MSKKNIPLILFAKQPIAGLVKTRMQPELSKKNAAKLAEVLLAETLQLTVSHWPGKVVLAIWPDLDHTYIQLMLSKYQVDAITQVEGDLGKKMTMAMRDVGYPCAVMGCDAPHCSKENLFNTYQLMQANKNVIGPTVDGGYYLLGLQSMHEQLFDVNSWGNETVLENTQRIANKIGVDFIEIEKLQDIDTYQDLVLASEQLLALRQFLIAK